MQTLNFFYIIATEATSSNRDFKLGVKSQTEAR